MLAHEVDQRLSEGMGFVGALELAEELRGGPGVLCSHGDVIPDLLDALIRRAVPHAPIPYFRAPFGSWGQSPQVAAALGMQPLGWRLAITDWEPPGTDVLVQRLRDGITPGAVVLMHDGGGDRSQTVAAVDRIIPELRAQGWRFTLPRRRG